MCMDGHFTCMCMDMDGHFTCMYMCAGHGCVCVHCVGGTCMCQLYPLQKALKDLKVEADESKSQFISMPVCDMCCV